MGTKLNKRKCKNCGEVFQKKEPLQFVCSPLCAIDYAKKQREKKKDQEFKRFKKERKPYTKSKEYKKQLQDEINKLARMIDTHFDYRCIDCDKPIGKQGHGAHYFNVGSNDNIRYNLHNIHLARAHCNQYDSEHKKNYPIGLKNRYGEPYLSYLEDEMRQDDSYIGLTELDVVEKLKIVRSIIRTFDTYKLKDSISARTMFNKIIGIYKKDVQI